MLSVLEQNPGADWHDLVGSVKPEDDGIFSGIEPHLAAGTRAMHVEKFHRYLSPNLLYEDAITSVVDLAAMPQLAEKNRTVHRAW